MNTDIKLIYEAYYKNLHTSPIITVGILFHDGDFDQIKIVNKLVDDKTFIQKFFTASYIEFNQVKTLFDGREIRLNSYNDEPLIIFNLRNDDPLYYSIHYVYRNGKYNEDYAAELEEYWNEDKPMRKLTTLGLTLMSAIKKCKNKEDISDMEDLLDV